MRVIIDMVVNHTSDKHPWFREARSSPDNRFRDFYVWRDRPTRTSKASIVFPDAEDSIWAFDDKAGQWYLHHFYSHQPDLNIGNEQVRDEIAKIAGFWLELGVDGFRVDAVPFLIDTSEVPDVEPRPARDPAAPPLVHLPPQGRRPAARRGQPASGAADRLLRRGGRRRGQPALQLPGDGGALALARAAGRRAARRGAPRDDRGLGGMPVRELRPQPRRADPGQALEERTPGGLRRVRTRRGHAALRPRPPPPAPDDARRRPAADPDGLQPAVLPAGHAGAVLRRGDRDGREPRHRGTDERPHADAVDRRGERRVLEGATVTPAQAASSKDGSDRSRSTSPRSAATRSHCSAGWND